MTFNTGDRVMILDNLFNMTMGDTGKIISTNHKSPLGHCFSVVTLDKNEYTRYVFDIDLVKI